MASLALAIMGMQLGIIVAIVRILPLRRGSLGITGILEGFSEDYPRTLRGFSKDYRRIL